MAKAKETSHLKKGIKKRTSIGNSVRSRPKHKQASKKKYRGQGR